MANPYNILIVDDSKTIVHYLIDILSTKEHNLHYTFSKKEALQIIQKNEIDILICDLMLPTREDGLETIQYFKEFNPNSKVLGISAHSEIENVVSMIKSGADDFISKTATKDQIIKKIDALKCSLVRKNGFLIPREINVHEEVMIGHGAVFRDIMEKTNIIADNQVDTCLIVGESGTGKELVAKTIHKLSARKDKPFVALNCAGMPENLIDSELFGFERGSFTGTYSTSIGKFELADKGILFLDEISEMPFHLQGKLLRVLENREITRIGGKKNIPIDVMILAATNQNLIEKIRQKQFREDIYYRLNLVKIELPPLRERKEDIPLLVEYFLNRVNTRTHGNIKLTAEALDELMKYEFPGNIRELKNIINNAALFCRNGTISKQVIVSYLKENQLANLASLNNKKNRPKVDDKMILEILQKNEGNITKTAEELGYTREGLSRKLNRMKNQN